ncbi:MAG: hypothetical protein H5T41_01635 [Methanomassiliicoccales archaeon]|jgi:hypothetical protein|nr:hypothetical protein [Methanomassiliicoccales archaeon]
MSESNGFTSKGFLILLIVVFPLLLLAAAVYLGSNICVTIAIITWIGIGLTILYLPHSRD